MTSPHQLHSSFLVRIWWEQSGDADDGRSFWRGRIQHVRSGETGYVQDLKGLLDFIERWTGDLSGPDETSIRLK